MVRRIFISLIFATIVGCASVAPTPDALSINADMLLENSPIMASTDDAEVGELQPADSEVTGLNAEMLAFIDQHVDRTRSDYFKLQQLLYAIIGDGSFGLDYDEQSLTSTETFATKAGNCMSFTNMFVAMAREVDLEVAFQEVDIPPDWTLQNDTFVLNRHLNVHVDLGATGEHVVDFNIEDFRASYDRRIISDERALAHFYNNRGIDRMQAGDPVGAFRLLRHALIQDEEFAPAWSNLGTLYNREGHTAWAEVSYLHALQVDSREYVAMSNLARLYETQGNEEAAAHYRKQVRYHRMRNPYYRYQLARVAFLNEEYDDAIDHLKYAIRKKEHEDSFYFLLGLSYLQTGNQKKAQRWLSRAEEVAIGDVLKRNYRSKLDLLLTTPPGAVPESGLR
jgi:Flp pilus assembly protein TadD